MSELSYLTSATEAVSSALAEFAAETRTSDIPAHVRDLAAQCLADTVGVSLGASGIVPEAVPLFRLAGEIGGIGPCGVLGSSLQLPVGWAAFVNGALGHMLDYDDIGPGGHVSVTLVPAALAIAQAEPGISGDDLLGAIAIGAEVNARLGLSIRNREWITDRGWFQTQVIGFISGAVVAGRLLKLDAKQMQAAMGIGFNQSSGSRQMAMGRASDMRAFQGAFVGQGAVIAAYLARSGFTGPEEFAEGKFGLYANYVGESDPDWSLVHDGLGSEYHFASTNVFKVWPSCGATRIPIAAVRKIMAEQHIEAQDIRAIRVIGGSAHTRQLMEPIGSKRRPRTSIDGKFSIPFTVGTVAAHGHVGLAAFTPDGLRDEASLRIADLVTYQTDDAPHTGAVGYTGVSIGRPPSVEIETADSQVWREAIDTVPGDMRTPLSWADLEAKFRDCAGFAASGPTADQVDAMWASVRDMDTAPVAADALAGLW